LNSKTGYLRPLNYENRLFLTIGLFWGPVLLTWTPRGSGAHLSAPSPSPVSFLLSLSSAPAGAALPPTPAPALAPSLPAPPPALAPSLLPSREGHGAAARGGWQGGAAPSPHPAVRAHLSSSAAAAWGEARWRPSGDGTSPSSPSPAGVTERILDGPDARRCSSLPRLHPPPPPSSPSGRRPPRPRRAASSARLQCARPAPPSSILPPPPRRPWSSRRQGPWATELRATAPGPWLRRARSRAEHPSRGRSSSRPWRRGGGAAR